MWGYVQTRQYVYPFARCRSCIGPGSDMTATEGETVNIHVRNNLTGLYHGTDLGHHSRADSFADAGYYPTWTDGTTGPQDKCRSKGEILYTETPVAGTGVYTWTSLKAGTYLYQSGTHPGVQVQMGLYGPLIVNPPQPVGPTMIPRQRMTLR